MSKALLSLFTKERLCAKCSCCSLKKGNMSYSLVIKTNCSQKRAICLTKFVFFVCFWQFFTSFSLLCPRANRSCCSSLRRSFLKNDVSDWLEKSKSKFPTLLTCNIKISKLDLGSFNNLVQHRKCSIFFKIPPPYSLFSIGMSSTIWYM